MLLARLAAFVVPAALALAADTQPSTAPPPHKELRQLTSDNFKKTVAHGAWLIEHFSPKCGFCRAFAPTWGRLATDMEYLESLAGFHMAQVNCLAQGDLCLDNEVHGYPQIDLYIDGKKIVEYKQDRNYDFVRKWIEEEATKYARSIVLGTDDEEGDTTESAPYRVANPHGKVVDVSPKELNEFKQEGPVFVDFFVPWCPHCKTLRPILEKLAGELQGKINIVAVNCDEYSNVCKENKIAGYPTLKLFTPFAGAWNVTEYMQERKVEAMKEFLKPAFTEPKMQPIKVEDMDKIIRNEDVYILYLQNFGTTLDDLKLVERSVKPLLGHVPIFTANDPLLYANLTIENPVPSSLLLAFAGGSPEPIARLPLPVAHDDEVPKFLQRHRYPLVTPLTKSTYREIMESEGDGDKPLIVLGAIHGGDEGAEEAATLQAISRAFRARGRQHRSVRFVTADSTFAVALDRMFGIRAADLPRLIVVDPVDDVFYDKTIVGDPAKFDRDSAFSVLEGISQGSAHARKIKSAAWAHRTMMGMRSWHSDHPFLAALYAVMTLAVVVWLCLKCLRRDIRKGSSRGGYMNEKGFAPKSGHRLD